MSRNVGQKKLLKPGRPKFNNQPQHEEYGDEDEEHYGEESADETYEEAMEQTSINNYKSNRSAIDRSDSNSELLTPRGLPKIADHLFSDPQLGNYSYRMILIGVIIGGLIGELSGFSFAWDWIRGWF